MIDTKRLSKKISESIENLKISSKLRDLKPLSYNQINTYMTCPSKYRFGYLKTATEYTAGEPAEKGGGLGLYSVITRTLNAAYASDKMAPLSKIMSDFERFWVSSDFGDPSEEIKYREVGKKILENFYQQNKDEKGRVARVSDWKDKDKKYPALSQKVILQLGEVKLSERIDRIMVLPNGSYESVIYRMSKPWGTDLRPALFLLAVKKLFPFRKHKIIYHYLKTNEKVVCDISKGLIEELENTVKDVAKGIIKNEFSPVKGSWCVICNFRNSCSLWEGFMPDRTRMRLSYSKMNVFLNCPRQYRFIYVDKVQTKPHSFFSLGTSIHEAFEQFYDYDGIFKRPGKRYLLQLLKTTWKSAGYKEDGADEQTYYKKAEKMLNEYYDSFVLNKKHKNAYKIEEYFELPIGKKGLMAGFIDRIDELADGSYEIIDYKTEPKWPDEKIMDDHKLQLTLYWWACKEGKLTPKPPAALSLFMLEFNKKVTFYPNMSGENLKKEDIDINKMIAANIEKVDGTVEEIEKCTGFLRSGKPADESFPPKENHYCPHCDFRQDCPLFTG